MLQKLNKANPLLTSLIACLVLIVYSTVLGLPGFFWDSANYCHQANWMLEHHQLSIPQELNNGHGLVWPVLIAISLKLSSFSLWGPFVLSLFCFFWTVYLFSLISNVNSPILLLIIVSAPGWIVQTLINSPDVLILLAVLGLINSIRKQSKLNFLLFSILLGICHQRGLIIYSTFIIVLAIKHREYLKYSAVAISAILSYWLILYLYNGWFVVNPEIESYRTIRIPNLSVITGCIISLVECGGLIIIASLLIVANKKHNFLSLLSIGIITIFLLLSFFLSNVFSARYYWIAYIIAFLYIIPNFSTIRITILSIALLSLNLFLIPLPYANDWDISYKGLFASAEMKRVNNWISASEIKPELVSTAYPFTIDSRYSALGKAFKLSDYSKRNSAFILFSNICNIPIPDSLANTQPIITFKSAYFETKLFLKPHFANRINKLPKI